MGFGAGVICERCGNQVCYRDGNTNTHYQLKREGAEHDLCSDCAEEIRKNKWDETNDKKRYI